jgi:hypothetical protein
MKTRSPEDYTLAALVGLPIYTIGREHRCITFLSDIIAAQYIFDYPNGYVGSIVVFEAGSQYGVRSELAVMHPRPDGSLEMIIDTVITCDVICGTDDELDAALSEIAKLGKRNERPDDNSILS